jgi:hypothetical protein
MRTLSAIVALVVALGTSATPAPTAAAAPADSPTSICQFLPWLPGCEFF